MEIKYRLMVRDDKVVEERYFDSICCEDMREALLKQQTPFGSDDSNGLWLFCPFCKKAIEY